MRTVLSDNRALAKEITCYARLCYDRKLVGAAGGNLSARVPGLNAFLVTASGVALRDVALENIVVVDSEGALLEGRDELQPSKEMRFHLSIYKTKPDVNAVIHVHSPYATAFAVARRPIPLATIAATLKLKQGALVPEAHPGSQELADNVARAIQASPPDANVLLLARHGMVAYGPNLCATFDSAELAEDTARIAFYHAQLQPSSAPWPSGARIIDLTAPLNERIQCYPTDPPFRRAWHVDFPDAGMCVTRMEMGAHAGTHVDAPLHFLEGAMDIANMPLEVFFGEALAIDAPKQPGEDITPADFANADIRPGDIVLFRTGWEERASSPRFFEGEWPGFTPEALDALLARKVKAIGGDIASADGPGAIGTGAPAHKRAMEAGLPIFEALVNLSQVVGTRFFFIGLPLKLEGIEASPIRAIAIQSRR